MNQAQTMALQVIKEQYNEQDLAELRQLLIDFNHCKMQNHLDKTIAEKGYTNQDFEQMKTGLLLSKIGKQIPNGGLQALFFIIGWNDHGQSPLLLPI